MYKEYPIVEECLHLKLKYIFYLYTGGVLCLGHKIHKWSHISISTSTNLCRYNNMSETSCSSEYQIVFKKKLRVNTRTYELHCTVLVHMRNIKGATAHSQTISLFTFLFVFLNILFLCITDIYYFFIFKF